MVDQAMISGAATLHGLAKHRPPRAGHSLAVLSRAPLERNPRQPHTRALEYERC